MIHRTVINYYNSSQTNRSRDKGYTYRMRVEKWDTDLDTMCTSSQVRERNDARGTSAWFRLSSITRLDVSLSMLWLWFPEIRSTSPLPPGLSRPGNSYLDAIGYALPRSTLIFDDSKGWFLAPLSSIFSPFVSNYTYCLREYFGNNIFFPPSFLKRKKFERRNF